MLVLIDHIYNVHNKKPRLTMQSIFMCGVGKYVKLIRKPINTPNDDKHRL